MSETGRPSSLLYKVIAGVLGCFVVAIAALVAGGILEIRRPPKPPRPDP